MRGIRDRVRERLEEGGLQGFLGDWNVLLLQGQNLNREERILDPQSPERIRRRERLLRYVEANNEGVIRRLRQQNALTPQDEADLETFRNGQRRARLQRLDGTRLIEEWNRMDITALLRERYRDDLTDEQRDILREICDAELEKINRRASEAMRAGRAALLTAKQKPKKTLQKKNIGKKMIDRN